MAILFVALSLIFVPLIQGQAIFGPLLPGAPDFADPCILRGPAQFWAFATGTLQTRIKSAYSRAITSGWTMGGDAMPTWPAWVNQNYGLWAPDVSLIGNTYVMYFCGVPLSSISSSGRCVGYAQSDNPGGPYAPVGRPLFCTPEGNGHSYIDPMGFASPDGLRKVVLKHGPRAGDGPGQSSEIQIHGASDSGTVATSYNFTILTNAGAHAPDNNVEAPVIINKSNDGGTTWYLTYSTGSINDNTYDTRYAVSDNLYEHPYTLGAKLLTSGLTSDSGAMLSGPGGASVLADDNRFFVFHSRYPHCPDGNCNNPRTLYACRVRYAGSGTSATMELDT